MTDDDNIISFPRIGFARPAGGQTPPPPPASPPTVGRPARRSPLQIAAGTTANPPAIRQGGGTPTTFQAGAPDNTGPRLGALSMAAILAVSVAAARGTVMALQDRRQRRMQRELEQAPFRAARLKHQLAMEQALYAAQEAAAKHVADRQQTRDKHANTMQGIGDKNAEQRAKNNKVPSSNEFGRKSLGGGDSKRGGKGAGTGSGGKPGGGAAGGQGSKKNPSGRGSGKSPAGGAGGAKKNGGGQSGGKNLSGGKRPQGAGAGGKQDRKNANGDGKTRIKPKGADIATQKKKAPTDGKSPSSNASSPAMERARRRQDRRDAGQKGKLERRAAKDAARAKEQAKDNKAARDHKHDAKKARQDAKDKIRNARMEAKEGRKEQVRQGKFDKAQQQHAQKTAAKQQKKDDAQAKRDQAKAKDTDRTKLWDALKNDTANKAGDRWAERDGVPPLWKNDKRRQKKAKQPKSETPKSETSGPGREEKWRRARDRARSAPTGSGTWAKDDTFGGTDSAPSFGDEEPGARRSPFGNASRTDETTWTVERDDQPASSSNGRPQPLPAEGPAGLPAAPEPHFPRPGTSRPRPTPPAPERPDSAQETAPMTAPPPAVSHRGGSAMDPQHATEITLDDAVDGGVKLKDDGMKTHRQANVLARRARTLRDVLRRFAEHLATQNNLTGPLFTAAMASLGESMDQLARMADEMESKSLGASERAEGAANRMEDAYRPISQATADAGLITPSAPVHNET
ncbi:hypothetical protein [Streptomyces sp. BH104]|uniref:hypothetical protein n=1 Tax=Streptomyces sp. BH104 TaxID=3410407 RepID=UPI003BB73405